jgi:hypothetical protein
MQAQRQAIARNVAERLFAAEAALDIAAARIAELNAALPMARLDARLAATIGQDAFTSSASAMMLVAETRGKIVATHTSLKQASDEIGLPAINYGDLLKSGSNEQRETAHRLRVA